MDVRIPAVSGCSRLATRIAGAILPIGAMMFVPAAAQATASAPADMARSVMAGDRLTAADSDWLTATDKRRGCTLEVPAMFVTETMSGALPGDLAPWGSATMSWSGMCIGGKASGNGVARMLAGGRVQGAWYGDAEAGRMTIGVIEDGNGVQAGRWNGGRLEAIVAPGDEPALDKALNAVRLLAANFRAERNVASASYYDGRIDLINSLRLGE